MIFTKLHIPQIHKRIVHRTSLFVKLDEGIKRKLIIVSAPAGYGKTTLISDWIKQNNISTAWCSIDARDNDPIEFLKLVITAVQKIHNDIGKSSLELLKSPDTASIEYIVELFINDLLTLKNEIVLVLDDLHLINNKQVIDILSALIDYKPKHFRLIISTRSDPPLALARLRSQNEILEIRSIDLSFSKNDISVLFNKKLNLGLTEKDLTLLEQKTEGWIAGLQLTALTIQGHKDISGYIEKMAGDNRYIMDYLLEEVLNIQNEEMNQFLLFTSVLEKMSASLCDALLKKNNSQILLESLEKSNMFLVQLDNEHKWYRYHHLFGDLLKQRLAIRYKDKIPELHNKASIWFEVNDMPLFAIEQSLLGGFTKRAMQLLDKLIEDLWKNTQYSSIYKFGSLFNEDEIFSSKNFCVIYAWTLALMGDLKTAESYLNKLLEKLSNENPKDKEVLGKVYLTYNFISNFTMNVKAAFEYSELAIKYLLKKDNGWNVWAHIAIGESYLLRFELDSCLNSFKSAIEISKKMNNLHFMLAPAAKSAYVLRLKGKYNESYTLCNELLEAFNSNTNIDKYIREIATSVLYLTIGFIQVEWNLLEEGAKNALKGYELSQNAYSPSFKGNCALVYAETCYKLGKLDEAISLLDKQEIMLKKNVSSWLNTLVYSFKNKIYIENEEFDNVNLPEKYISEKDKNNIFEYYFFNITIARHFISNSNYSEAIDLLNELSDSLKNDEAYELLIEAELLKAKVCAKHNEKNNAIKSVSNAILLAQSEGLIRTFIVEGEEIYELLKEVKQEKCIKSSELLDSISNDFLNKLLTAFEREKRLQKLNKEDVLSNRELDTLKLIAEDLTNQEIANELYISVNTVKTHVRNILLILEAKNRREAVLKAKGKGILLSNML